MWTFATKWFFPARYPTEYSFDFWQRVFRPRAGAWASLFASVWIAFSTVALAVPVGYALARLALPVRASVAVDAEEDPSPADLFGIEDHQPGVEAAKDALDLGQTPINLFGRIICLSVFSLQAVIFLSQCFARGPLLLGQIDRGAQKLVRAHRVALGEAQGDFDPLPTPGRDGLGFSLQFLADQPFQQDRVLQPTAIILLEEVTQDEAIAWELGKLIRQAKRHYQMAGLTPSPLYTASAPR